MRNRSRRIVPMEMATYQIICRLVNPGDDSAIGNHNWRSRHQRKDREWPSRFDSIESCFHRSDVGYVCIRLRLKRRHVFKLRIALTVRAFPAT
jgi:hypothetical protein